MTVEERIMVLEKRIEELTNQVGILEDTHAIRSLQHKYGYYMDKAFYEAIVELFSEDCEIHFLAGIFRGKAGAKRLFIDDSGRSSRGNRRSETGCAHGTPPVAGHHRRGPGPQDGKGAIPVLYAGRNALHDRQGASMVGRRALSRMST